MYSASDALGHVLLYFRVTIRVKAVQGCEECTRPRSLGHVLKVVLLVQYRLDISYKGVTNVLGLTRPEAGSGFR